MAKGRILFYNHSKKNGIITQEDGTNLEFDLRYSPSLSGRTLEPGVAVQYTLATLKDKLIAIEVQIVSQARKTQKPPETQTPPLAAPSAQKPKAPPSGYRFLNPYNFVRFLNAPTSPAANATEEERARAKLLTRCAPPPHDRYVGLSGRITCEIEAKTPVFVSDSHAVTEEKEGPSKGHRTYRFFEVDGKPAIPASSLRGMVRSVFEAVTNSCWVVFDGDRRLPYRNIGLARKLRSGIVRQLPKGNQPGLIALCEEARVGAYTGGKRRVILDSSWKTGETAFAIITTSKSHDRYAVSIARTREELGNDSGIVQGRVKITGEGNIDRKYCERFFYNEETDQSRWASFSADCEKDYNTILAQQYETKGFKTKHQHRALTVGDMVYVDDGKSVKNIAAVRVPRLLFREPIETLLPKKPSLPHRCSNPAALCPACRVFGWVWDKPPKNEPRVAYAGRVRFGHAQFEESDLDTEKHRLAILSSPKPTTTMFYLAQSDGSPADKDTTYDDPSARLRGRKVYRHFGQAWLWNEASPKDIEATDQNRTLRDTLKIDAKSSFTVDFENLAELELGALVWALELEPGLFHRLGFGKPLGLGSVSIKITKVDLLQLDKRYAALQAEDGWKPLIPTQWQDLKGKFLGAMQGLYGKPFDQRTLADLRALLANPKVNHVHYPRTECEPQPEGENFNWFIGNKKKQIPLPMASDDHKGFPILKRDGNEVEC